MKRAGFSLLLIALATTLFLSCQDERNLMAPGDDITPSQARPPQDGLPDDYIADLIKALYPARGKGGLQAAALNQYANILFMLGIGHTVDAQNMARNMVADALVQLADEQLNDPDDPEIPVSTAADGVRLLSAYLYSATGLDVLGELPPFDPGFQQELDDAPDRGVGWLDPEIEGDQVTTDEGWARVTSAGTGTGDPVLITFILKD